MMMMTMITLLLTCARKLAVKPA